MTRARRRRRRIWTAVLCCIPTLLVLAAWGVGANTSLLAPGRALPERTAAGIAGHRFQLYRSSNAIEFDSLPPGVTRPPSSSAAGPTGRQFLRTDEARLVDRGEGVEWHGTFATHFTYLGIPMWLPLLATTPLLLVAARQIYLLRKSSHRGAAGACAHCGHELSTSDARCPECGSPRPSSDPLSSVLLSASPTIPATHARRDAP
jgi:hypothetical protein